MTYPLSMHAPGRPAHGGCGCRSLGAALAVAAVCAVARPAPLGRSEPVAPVAAAEGDAGVAAIRPARPRRARGRRARAGVRRLVGLRVGRDRADPRFRATCSPTSSASRRSSNGVRGSGYLKARPGRTGLRRAHRRPRPGARPRPHHRRGFDQRPAAVPDRVPGCRDRRLGRARGPLPRRRDRHPRARPAGAAGRELHTARIDADLRELAAARGWWYISPIADDWITTANYLDVIDTGPIGRDHPSTDGHAYLAGRVADAIESMEQQPAIVADAPHDEDALTR